MQKFDYIIVGLGIGGISLVHRLVAQGKKVCVFDSGRLNATSVAAGVVNPVVLKHINPVWKAAEFLNEAHQFYNDLEKAWSVTIKSELPLLRVLADIEEQNNWSAASDRANLAELLDPQIVANDNKHIHAPFGFGKVNGAFRIDTVLLLQHFASALDSMGCLKRETFDLNRLTVSDTGIGYDELIADRIIFAEGVGFKENPLFSQDVLIPKKGEYITFYAPELRLDTIIKGSFFIVPVGANRYQAGATFAHGDNSIDTTHAGRYKLLKAVHKIVTCPFEIVDQTAGLRPTVKDRRPLLGALNGNNRTLLLNGFGTRGLLMAPLLSKWLLAFAQDHKPLPGEVDLKRFGF
jgi:glycine/D-amino acid oxidase-like deaminating enzyme